MDIMVDNLNFSSLRLKDETGEFIEYDMTKELRVNEDNLMREMLEQPSKYIYWATILERIKMFEESVELELEILVAHLDEKARMEIEGRGAKATKDSVDAFVKRQPEYEAKRRSLQYYNQISGRMQRIVKAFEQRKDMLQSYGKQIAEQKSFGAGAGTRFENTGESPFGR